MGNSNEDKAQKRDRVMKIVLDCINREETLKEPLSEYLQYHSFLEREIIPAVGENVFETYLRKMVSKAIQAKKTPILSRLSTRSIHQAVFKSGILLGREAIERHPKSRRICENVIATIKTEKTGDSTNILFPFEEKISKRETLAEPITYYKENVDWRYLKYIENTLIAHIGDEKFLSYVQELLLKNADNGTIKTYSFKELNELIFGVESSNGNLVSISLQDGKTYPRLIRNMQKAIENVLSMNTMGERRLTTRHLITKVSDFDLMLEDEFRKYCRKIVDIEFHKKQKRITQVGFYRELFNESKMSRQFSKGNIPGLLKHEDILSDLLENESLNQVEFLREWNMEGLKSESNIWSVYFQKELSVHSLKLDFTLIHSEKLRKEIKNYLYESYNVENPRHTYVQFTNMLRGLRALEEHFDIESLLDVNRFQAAFLIQHLEYEGKYSLLTIKKTIVSMSQITEYILNKEHRHTRYRENFFKSIKVYNSAEMAKNTKFIPDLVIEQISKYISELEPIYQIMYELFSYTGLRAKEIIESNKMDFKESKTYPGYVKMKYVSFKTSNARKKRGLSEKLFVYIPVSLYQKILEFIAQNEEDYNKYDIEKVFARKTNSGIAIPQSSDFCIAINKLIKKHNICDLTGELWNFTTRQARKTVAVNLIDNDATPQEVANQLGHMSSITTEKYYIEVKKAKLAELNTEFFKKKFEIDLGVENLKLYSEEERKQLYIDFCLNKREVEFGTCTKHPSEGRCGSRVGASSCTVCPKLCTGKKYLDKWSDLKASQTEIVRELTKIYSENNIEDYTNFIEYKKETKLLERYSAVIYEIISQSEV